MCQRATTLDAVPTIIARLLEHGRYERLNRLRWIAFASEPMPPAVLERWWELAPDVQTYEFYGMTEMLTVTHAGPEVLRCDPTTVGVAYPTSRVDVVGADLEPVPTGEEGEVICASPARMRGYLGDEAATAEALVPRGAIRTGDLGRLDELGRLRLTGRLKDLIISGGMNIAPAEIEATACRHPQVAVAAAVGVPDDTWGETPVVVAVPAQGNSLSATELLKYCRSELTDYKRPSGAAVVDSLPVTGIGKSAKARLREAILNGEVEVVRSS
jgi:fatty-acyl-CoA synthase